MVSFQTDGVKMPDFDFSKISKWLTAVASGYGYRIGDLVYMFCTDEVILKSNREFLGHDYYTDIITFDYTIGNRVGADILISLDTVRSNSEQLGVAYDCELLRVIVHGVLHLCGFKDKTQEERSGMEEAENKALALYNEI